MLKDCASSSSTRSGYRLEILNEICAVLSISSAGDLVIFMVLFSYEDLY